MRIRPDGPADVFTFVCPACGTAMNLSARTYAVSKLRGDDRIECGECGTSFHDSAVELDRQAPAGGIHVR